MEVSQNMNENVDNIHGLVELSSDAGSMLNSTAEIMHSSASSAESSLTDSKGVASNTEHLIDQIETIHGITREYVGEVDDIIEVSNALDQFAQNLESKLKQFKTS